MDKPLISFILVVYNQEPFIREAVESALAQSYSPLEIIVMDDCSTDRSYEIAQQTVAVYKGPHCVRLCRNQTNLGIGGNINRAMELCRGELIVGAAGDDVSLPTRVAVTCQAWEQSGRRATSIFSSYMTISEDGIVQGVGGLRGDRADHAPVRELAGSLFEFLSNKTPVVNGCTHAWSPELVKFFGPLNSDLEDLVFSFRTLAIGKMLYVHQPLVKYRRHGANVSFLAERDDTQSFEHRERRLRWTDSKHVMAYEDMLTDIETLYRRGRIDAIASARLKREAERMRREYAVEVQMMEGGWRQRWLTVANTMRCGNLRLAVHSAPRALPRRFFRALWLLRSRWRSWIQASRPAKFSPSGIPIQGKVKLGKPANG
jgi:glycosyltransferase involved in cell wall biosynthesis